MTRHFAILAVTLLAVSFVSGQAPAFAQGGGAGGRALGRPTVSPYTNMVFADGLGQLGIGGGYQTLVRPFVDGRRAINANSAAISRLESQAASGYGGGGRPNRAGIYMNYSHYYPSMSSPGR
jgi:hypothetical protein